MTMLTMILRGTPGWVWPLLAALLALGVAQSRDRQVRRGQLLALPLALLALGGWSMVPALQTAPPAVAAWLATLSAGFVFGRSQQPSSTTRWLPERQRLQLAGSWWPMALIVVIFGLRYASNVGFALHPEWRAMLAVQLPLALAFGTLSGLFLGRVWTLLAITRQSS